MEPGSEIEEAGEGPAADTQKHAALVGHSLRQRIERDHDPVIEIALLGPGQRVAGTLSVTNQGVDQRGINDRLDPNLWCPEARKVAGQMGGMPHRQRRHARRTVR